MEALFRWMLGGVLLIGSPFIAIGGCEAIETASTLERSVRTRGTVVDNRLVVDHRDGLEERSYQPVVEFRDAAGRVRRFSDPAGSLPPDYAVGEAVDVAFEASDPSKARLTSWKRLWLVPVLLVAVGLLPALVCWLVFTAISRSTPSRAPTRN